MDIYEPVIAEMRAQIEECQRVIVTLEMMRTKAAAAGNSPSAVASPSQQNGQPNFTNDAFFGMTIGDAAKKYLTAIKRTATARAITDALLAGGFKSAAKNFVESVRSILSRNPTFVLVNGEFGLAEWYPGRKAAPPKKNGGTSLEQDEAEDEELSPEKAFGKASIALPLPSLQ
ncbi:MAG TPA: hypothetical protein VK574_16370 [Terracidiphilus sp.]|nr:hypothetical protein [Terracidiphilus sp.]